MIQTKHNIIVALDIGSPTNTIILLVLKMSVPVLSHDLHGECEMTVGIAHNLMESNSTIVDYPQTNYRWQ